VQGLKPGGFELWVRVNGFNLNSPTDRLRSNPPFPAPAPSITGCHTLRAAIAAT
jgi:hypothetical protein